MKIKHLLFAVAAIILCTAWKPTVDCSKFKTGTFKMWIGTKIAIIKRSPDMQTEKIDTMKTPDTLMVKWLDDCTYTLTPTPYTLNKTPRVPKNLVLTVTIDATTDSSYMCTTGANISDKKFKTEIIKISNSYN
jgi:hypothetical protein